MNKLYELFNFFFTYFQGHAREDMPSQQVWSTGRTAISKRKTEVMTLKVSAPAPVLLDDQALPSAETFTYIICGQHCQTGLRYQLGHSEQIERSQEHP